VRQGSRRAAETALMSGGARQTAGAVELRRGVLELAVLLLLRLENHGYAVRQSLKVNGLQVKEGTLYPLLRRLESKGLLRGRWDSTGDRLRKFYCLTEHGQGCAEEMKQKFDALVVIIEGIHGKA